MAARRGSGRAACGGDMIVAEKQPNFAAGCIVSTTPLITVSKRETALPLGLASFAPDRFADRPSLNLLGLTWSYEIEASAQRCAQDFAEAASVFPKARFVMLANTPSESVQFSRAGVPNILANELIFLDERLFVPATPLERKRPRYDAVYVARLSKTKRHDLARALGSVLLAYSHPELADLERVKGLLPQATFANHEFNGGSYRLFDERALRDVLLQCAVGICLSPVEGAMRASLEYRLCGLPVVSIKSAGGRDRYLMGPHVRVVDEDPNAIANAVRELKANAFDPFAVRDYVGPLVGFDRRNFLSSFNKVVAQQFGAARKFDSFLPFMRFPVAWRKPAEIFAPLDAERV
jgi:hypothetical protein